LSRLQTLAALLATSRDLFNIQNSRAKQLIALLEEQHPNQVKRGDGFERVFTSLYDALSDEEAELHGIIRSITIGGLYPVNKAILEWLQADTDFKTGFVKSGLSQEFARKLREVELHVRLWIAKYDVWIPSNPKRALVYLADEAAHGPGFPKGVDEMVEKMIAELKP
jgi:hypothetical protein